MALTSAELFAAKGDAWNTPNYQHPALPVVRTTERHGRIVDVELEFEIEGYGHGPNGHTKPHPYEPRRRYVRPKIEQQARPWTPEYRPVKPTPYVGPNQPLNEDQLRVRRYQRAAEKARLTRARNMAEARAAARLDALQTLLVKVSHDV